MEEEKSDPIFQNDVIYMKSLVGKSVLIETSDNKEHKGIVYVIDPVFKTVVLVPNSEPTEIIFVLFNSIKSFKVTSDVVFEEFTEKSTNQISTISEEAIQRKQTLTKWLKHMFINVEDDGKYLIVQEHVRIEAPYERHNCICDNSIVLEKIMNIIDLMPADFQ